jgi:hypothetical protein
MRGLGGGGIEALEQCKAHSEDVALALADQWMELVTQLYRRVARNGGEDASRAEAVWGLAEITNRPTGLTDLGPTTHVPARIRLILRTQRRDCLPAQKRLETTGDGQ